MRICKKPLLIDGFARRILDLNASNSAWMHFILDALKQA